MLTSADCATRSGTYAGDDVDCTPATPTGCCNGGFYDGQVTTQTECWSGGGSYAGDGTTCGGGGDCTGSECCCGSLLDVYIEAQGMPNPGGPGGPGGGATEYEFTQTGEAVGNGSCVWTVNGDWTVDGVSATGSVTVQHIGNGCFQITGVVDGQAVFGNSCTGNVTIGTAQGSCQVSHDDEDSCLNE